MMTIQLPADLEGEIQAEMRNGHFASEADMVATAVRDYLLRRRQETSAPETQDTPPGSGSIGAMREDADFLNEIIAGAMKARREQPWRFSPSE